MGVWEREVQGGSKSHAKSMSESAAGSWFPSQDSSGS